MRRCTRCILPETYPDITFDEKGVCNKCKEYDAKHRNQDYTKLKIELAHIINWAKKQNKRYDCLVPFSGGKDSTYTLYLCREKYKLKILAVNFNNGLRTTAAIKNIDNIIKKTDVGYVCYGPNWELMKKLYREFFLKTGQFCFPCDMGIWATVHRVAEQYDVPLIVSGFSTQIESRGAKIYSYNSNLFKKIAGNLINSEEAEDFLPETKWHKIVRRLKHFTFKRYRKQISLPEYIPWVDSEIKETITKELDWMVQEDGSTDHIDCLFAQMKNYLVVQKWGFGEKTTKYSSMIRAGQMDREEALKKAKQEEIEGESRITNNFIQILGVDKENIKSAKEKSHEKYF